MKIKTPALFFILSFFIFSSQALAEKQINVAVHIHSSISSGKAGILEIAKAAKEKNVDVVIMTDLFYEHYEYGIRPFEGFIKASIERGSVSKYGIEKYFQDLQSAMRKVPEVLILDGVAATPFYYWSGNLKPGPLVLNGRAKDLLVMGLKDSETYKNLPVTGNGKGFGAYDGDKFEAPYQKLIDYVNADGRGVVFWSHPQAHENEEFRMFGAEVQLHTPEYGDEMLGTSDYTGFGVYSVELAQIDNPLSPGLSSPGRLWDKVLAEYCAGKRKKPVWAIGEIDYNGIEIRDITSILNVLTVSEKRRDEVFGALRRGKLYLVTHGDSDRRLVLENFRVEDSSGNGASMGDELSVSGPVTVKGTVRFSDSGSGTLHWILIKNGEILKEWEQPAPLDLKVTDETASSKSFYRLIVTSPTGGNLLSNPVFVSSSD